MGAAGAMPVPFARPAQLDQHPQVSLLGTHVLSLHGYIQLCPLSVLYEVSELTLRQKSLILITYSTLLCFVRVQRH